MRQQNLECRILIPNDSEWFISSALKRALPSMKWQESDSAWDKVRVWGSRPDAEVGVFRAESPGPFRLTVGVTASDGSDAERACLELRDEVLTALGGRLWKPLEPQPVELVKPDGIFPPGYAFESDLGSGEIQGVLENADLWSWQPLKHEPPGLRLAGTFWFRTPGERARWHTVNLFGTAPAYTIEVGRWRDEPEWSPTCDQVHETVQQIILPAIGARGVRPVLDAALTYRFGQSASPRYQSPSETLKVLQGHFSEMARECPDCGTQLKSTGLLLHDNTGWAIDFFCEKDRVHTPLCQPDDEKLIERETKGVDPAVLSDFGPPAKVAGSGYELIARLGRQGWYIDSWTARMAGAESNAPLTMLRTHWLRTYDEYCGGTDLRPDAERLLPQFQHATSLAGRGLAPGRLYQRGGSLVFERPFQPERLTDRFPPMPAAPPSRELLAAIDEIAAAIDHLSDQLGAVPWLKHGNLLWTGQNAVLVDYGLDVVRRLIERSYDGPRQLWGGITSMIANWADLQPLDDMTPEKELRSSAAILAGAWFAIRVGRSLYTPANPQDSAALDPVNVWAATYELARKRQPPLDDLADPGERELLMAALAEGSGRRFHRASELAAALLNHFGHRGKIALGTA